LPSGESRAHGNGKRHNNCGAQKGIESRHLPLPMDMPPILAALECNPQKLLREARNEFATSRGFCRKRFGTELESFRFGALPLEVGRDGLSQFAVFRWGDLDLKFGRPSRNSDQEE